MAINPGTFDSSEQISLADFPTINHQLSQSDRITKELATRLLCQRLQRDRDHQAARLNDKFSCAC